MLRQTTRARNTELFRRRSTNCILASPCSTRRIWT
jgi:hypothetical protein